MRGTQVSNESVRAYLSDMLKELAELADGAQDDDLHDFAFKMRLLSGHTALKPKAQEERSASLSAQRSGPRLVTGAKVASPHRQPLRPLP